MADIPTKITTTDIMRFFGLSAKEFRKEWQDLSAEDKAEIRTLILAERAK